jgi:uncharacterized protein YegL
MPKLDQFIIANSNFAFSANKPADLDASEYTLVSIAIDVSGSVEPWADELAQTLQTVVQACQMHPRSDNVLLRVLSFNDRVHEIHGFLPLSDIKASDYKKPNCSGGTALYDAAFSALGASTSYAKMLTSQDYLVNAILFVISDGEDNSSNERPIDVLNLRKQGIQQETLDSQEAILIGVNAAGSKQYLEAFRLQAGFDQYLDLANADKASLAKLAGFMTRSISVRSTSLGTLRTP